MRSLLIVIFLSGSVLAQTPIDFQKWDNGNNSFSLSIGGSVTNYEKPDQSWAAINNNYTQEGDSVWFVDDAVMKLRVNKNGTSKMTLPFDGQDYVVTSRLRGIAFFNMSTEVRQWFDPTMDFSTFSVDSNMFKWEDVGFGGVDYHVRKLNGQTLHTIYFDSTFLDSAVARYNLSLDTANIALVNVSAYTLSGNIDNHDSALGFTDDRLLKQLNKKYKFRQHRERLHYPGSDTLKTIFIKQFWEIRDDTLFCFEAVRMSEVKRIHELYPSSKIWHNATLQITGETDVEDCDIYTNTFDDGSFGGRVFMRAGSGFGGIKILMRFFLTGIESGSIITNVLCSLNANPSANTAGSVDVMKGFKPFIEGNDNEGDNDCTVGATANHWDCANTFLWESQGANCAVDAGINNTSQDAAESCVLDSADRSSTAMDTQTVTTSNTEWIAWTIDNDFAQDAVDGVTPDMLLVFVRVTSTDKAFDTSEATSDKPRLFVTYTPPTTGQKVMIRK